MSNISQIEDVKIKKINTSLKKYGIDNVFQSEEIKEKIKSFNVEKYGVTHPMKDENFREKVKKSNLKKYGFENPSQSEEIKEKIKNRFFEKYGVSNPMKCSEIVEKLDKIKKEKYGDDYFYQHMTLRSIQKRFTSIHKKICDYLIDKKIDFRIEERFEKYFVDIFIPSKNIAIEAYGDFWHGNPKFYMESDLIMNISCKEKWESDKNRIFELKKTIREVLIFWEDDINKNFEYVANRIQEELNFED